MKRYDVCNLTAKDTKKYLLSLFDGEDVFIEKNDFDGIVVRPKEEYNKEYYTRNFLLRIPPIGMFINTARHLVSDENIFCSGAKSYDLSETGDQEAAISQTKDLIIEYNKAIKNWKILHKHKKITEIRAICDKFTV